MESTEHEVDPHTRGAKLDFGKPRVGLLKDFAHALNAVAQVATYGAKKYTEGGWLEVPNGQARYRDALWRHMIAVEPRDESGYSHLAHMAWNALALLELNLREEANAHENTPKVQSPSSPLHDDPVSEPVPEVASNTCPRCGGLKPSRRHHTESECDFEFERTQGT